MLKIQGGCDIINEMGRSPCQQGAQEPTLTSEPLTHHVPELVWQAGGSPGTSAQPSSLAIMGLLVFHD